MRSSLLENNPDLDQKKIEESLGSVAAVRTREDFVALLIDGLPEREIPIHSL